MFEEKDASLSVTGISGDADLSHAVSLLLQSTSAFSLALIHHTRTDPLVSALALQDAHNHVSFLRLVKLTA